MFVTTDGMRCEVLPAGWGGAHVWSAVELEVLAPVLLVTLRDTTEGHQASLRRVFFVVARQFEQLIAGPSVDVQTVNLLSPPHVNQSSGWSLEPLRELWKYSDASGNQNGWVYTVEGGRTYSDLRGEGPVNLAGRRLVFALDLAVAGRVPLG